MDGKKRGSGVPGDAWEPVFWQPPSDYIPENYRPVSEYGKKEVAGGFESPSVSGEGQLSLDFTAVDEAQTPEYDGEHDGNSAPARPADTSLFTPAAEDRDVQAPQETGGVGVDGPSPASVFEPEAEPQSYETASYATDLPGYDISQQSQSWGGTQSSSPASSAPVRKRSSQGNAKWVAACVALLLVVVFCAVGALGAFSDGGSVVEDVYSDGTGEESVDVTVTVQGEWKVAWVPENDFGLIDELLATYLAEQGYSGEQTVSLSERDEETSTFWGVIAEDSSAILCTYYPDEDPRFSFAAVTGTIEGVNDYDTLNPSSDDDEEVEDSGDDGGDDNSAGETDAEDAAATRASAIESMQSSSGSSPSSSGSSSSSSSGSSSSGSSSSGSSGSSSSGSSSSGSSGSSSSGSSSSGSTSSSAGTSSGSSSSGSSGSSSSGSSSSGSTSSSSSASKYSSYFKGLSVKASDTDSVTTYLGEEVGEWLVNSLNQWLDYKSISGSASSSKVYLEAATKSGKTWTFGIKLGKKKILAKYKTGSYTFTFTLL